MRILYVSQYFPPEIGAPAVRVSELARRWREWGHDVRVLTGFPNHPEGVVPPEYRSKLRRFVMEETWRGVPVYRTWLYPAPNRGVVRRSASFLSFGASAALRGALLGFHPEVVIGTSPQLLCAGAARLIAKRFGARFVFEVRDLWPESLFAVGAAEPSSLLYRGLASMANWLYKSADQIIAVTDSSRDEISSKGIPANKVAVVRNGVDVDAFSAEPPARSGRFTVSYIGAIGMAHALETALDAAALLRHEPEIRFVFVGGGAQREALQRKAREANLENVEFRGPRPWTEIPQILSESDACLVHLAKTPLFETVLPSKMFEAMAAGRPIILGVRGEAQRLLEEAGAGLAIEPESAEQLRDAVMTLYRDRELSQTLGRSGRLYAKQEASYEARARHYLETLENVTLRRPSDAIEEED